MSATSPVAMLDGHLNARYTTEKFVTCDECGFRFWIGYPQAFKTEQQLIEHPLETLQAELESILREDHKQNRRHQRHIVF